MPKRLTLLVICGFGIGTSLVLRMTIESVLKKYNIEAEVINSDLTSGTSMSSDMVFTSNDLYDLVVGQVSVPVLAINNFLDPLEIESKALSIIQDLL